MMFLISLLFVLSGVAIFFGKADRLMVNCRLRLKGWRPVLDVKRYNKERMRPLLALTMFVVALMIAIMGLFPSAAQYVSVAAFVVILPMAIIMELWCREKDKGKE
jgi:hypothetical protein